MLTNALLNKASGFSLAQTAGSNKMIE